MILPLLYLTFPYSGTVDLPCCSLDSTTHSIQKIIIASDGFVERPPTAMALPTATEVFDTFEKRCRKFMVVSEKRWRK
jgi:hypothetical protein